MATAHATSTPPPSFPTKGSFKRIPFPRLVREIARAKLTGNLYLLSDQTKKVVFFEEGQPTFVRSNVLSECLGQVLSQEGLITVEQCEQTLEAIRRTGKKQGELLVEMGILSEGNLRYGLEAQLRTKLYEIFSWDDGRYQFKQDATSTSFGVRMGLSAEDIILDAVQERYSEERAHKALVAVANQYPMAAEAGQPGDAVALLPEERHFLTTLDGSRTVKELLADTELVLPSLPALLLGLIFGGWADLSAKPQPRRSRPPAPPARHHDLSDDALRPTFATSSALTEYEDTPVPGALPQAREILGDHEADFASVEQDMDASGRLHVSPRESGALSELVAAEPDEVEETFEDEEILDDFDGDVEVIDDGRPTTVPPPLPVGASPPSAWAHDELDQLIATLDEPIDLLSVDELDDVELAANARLGSLSSLRSGSFPTMPAATVPNAIADDNLPGADENPEIVGAIRFNEAEGAMAAEDYPRAAELLEQALKHGFDVAELHAMLAYARFITAGSKPGPAATHALQLLDYAESMDPSLDLVQAYRGAIHLALGQPIPARTALARALELNPYSELAMHLMDRLG